MKKNTATKKASVVKEETFLDNEVFIIEKDVPMQPILKGVVKYPFYKMDVNDSFVAPKTDARNIRSASSSYGKRTDKKFTIRTQGGVVRIWRIA